MRSLIVAPPSLADAVMVQPLVALLGRLDPEGRVEVLADAALAPLFAAMPGVAATIAARELAGPLRPWGLARLARRVAASRPDRAFVLDASRRAALVLRLARVPQRVGPAPPAGTGPDAGPASRRPPVERFALLAFDPAHPPPGPVPDPVLRRDPRAEAAALDRAGLAPGTRLLALCVAADGARRRRWPARHWASLIALAAAACPELEPVLVGDAADRAFATEIAALSGRPLRNLCGRQPLGDAIATLAQAEAVAAHDCGLMHVAAAYSRPMVAVFGPTDPRWAPPRSARARVQWLAGGCRACDATACGAGQARCTAGVAPGAVFRALLGTMRFAAPGIR
ncbi:MAG TPA: lipopolysaccharide heptosyltransferase II [Burkholderiaceae bacterium]|nr:lipopolysaccharide heptosyltransferase II [Burkholderiaceae bacterium]